MKLFKNKRGSIQDIILLIVFASVISIVAIIGFKVATEFNDQFGSMDNVPTMASDGTNQVTGYFTSVIDNSFFIVIIAISLGTLALAALIRVHPVFIFFFIIALAVLIVVAMTMSNIYYEMASTTQLQAEADQLTFISTVMTYLPWFVAVLGTLVAIIMYKTRSQGGIVQ